MPLYSFSQVQLFNQCPLKYRYRYLDKIIDKDFEETADMLLGKAVHYALEQFYNDLNQFREVSDDRLIGIFDDYWNEKFNDKIVVRQEASADDYITRGRKYLQSYAEKFEHDDNLKIINTEERLTFELDENIKFQGFVDRLDKKDKTFVINDYKTNIRLPSEDKTMYEEQLTLYGLGVKQKYGRYLDKIRARLYYLHFDIEDEWDIDDEKLELVREKYKNYILQIEDSRFKFNMGDKDAFSPNETPLCRFCDYQTICPLFSHAHIDDEVVVGDKTIKGIVDEYVEMGNKISELKAQKESLKDLIVKYLEDKDFKKLIGNNYQISVSKQENYVIIDSDKLYELLKSRDLLEQTMTLDRYKIAKMIKDAKINFSILKDVVEVKESYTFRGKKS